MSLAVVTLKGADKPQFLLVVEGDGVGYVTIIRAKKQVVEKFSQVSDS